MATKPTRYPFDPYGKEASNFVKKERQVITPKNGFDFHYFIPTFAPFFTKDLEIYTLDSSGKKNTLIEGVDYTLGMRFIQGTFRTMQPISGSISFINRSYVGNIYLDYRTVGGIWNLDQKEILRILAEWEQNPVWTTWEQVANLPETFPPIEHIHPVNDTIGMGEIYDVLVKILASMNDSSQIGLTEHKNDKNNPHKVNKTHVGLANLLNLPILPQGKGSDKTDNYYMTPRSVMDVVNVQFKPLLDKHILERNPHKTQAVDVGAYTTLEVDNLLKTKLGINDVAVDSNRFGQRTPEQFKNYVLLGTSYNTTRFNEMTYSEVVSDILSRVESGGGGGGTGGGISYEELQKLLVTSTCGNATLWGNMNHDQYAAWFQSTQSINAATFEGKTLKQIKDELNRSVAADSVLFNGLNHKQYADWLIANNQLSASTIDGHTYDDILKAAKAQKVDDSTLWNGMTHAAYRTWLFTQEVNATKLEGSTKAQIIADAKKGVDAARLEGKTVEEIATYTLSKPVDATTFNKKTYAQMMSEIDQKIVAGSGGGDANTLNGKTSTQIKNETKNELDGKVNAGKFGGMTTDVYKTEVLKGKAANTTLFDGRTYQEVMTEAWASPRTYDLIENTTPSPRMVRLASIKEEGLDRPSFLMMVGGGTGLTGTGNNDMVVYDISFIKGKDVTNFGRVPAINAFYMNNPGQTLATIQSQLGHRFWVGYFTNEEGVRSLGLFFADENVFGDSHIELWGKENPRVMLGDGKDIGDGFPNNLQVNPYSASGKYCKCPITFHNNGEKPKDWTDDIKKVSDQLGDLNTALDNMGVTKTFPLGKTGANLNSFVTTIRASQSANAQALPELNYPESLAGEFNAYSLTTLMVLQEYRPYSKAYVWRRYGYRVGGTGPLTDADWKPWVKTICQSDVSDSYKGTNKEKVASEFALGEFFRLFSGMGYDEPIILKNTDNLRDMNQGFYTCSNSTFATPALNYPTKNSGRLFVLGKPGAKNLVYLSANDNEMFICAEVSGVWREWKSIVNNESVYNYLKEFGFGSRAKSIGTSTVADVKSVKEIDSSGFYRLMSAQAAGTVFTGQKSGDTLIHVQWGNGDADTGGTVGKYGSSIGFAQNTGKMFYQTIFNGKYAEWEEVVTASSLVNMGVGDVSPVYATRDFNKLPLINQVYTVDQEWLNGPEGKRVYTGIVSTIARSFNAGVKLIETLYEGEKSWERRAMYVNSVLTWQAWIETTPGSSKVEKALVGVPIPYPSNVPPTGYIAMIGQVIDKVKYPILAQLYGNNLTDMRDYYIRGANGTKGGIPLVKQDDCMQQHQHSISPSGMFMTSWRGGGIGHGSANTRDLINQDTSNVMNARVGDETRPISVMFNYICLAG